MGFNTISFGIFFFIVFFLYWIFLRKSILYRNIFLVIVSYIFYGWWDWRFLLLIFISSLTDFVVGYKIGKESNKTKRKLWLLLSITVNIGFLAFFKYYNFFIESMSDLCSFFGSNTDNLRLNIILPVGISFYTFQTLSYTIDIYYKRFEPTRNIFAFIAFVSFFPQLVAGPIERAKKLLPQFLKQITVDYETLRSGLLLMSWGFLKKIVIADRLAIFVNNAYSNIEQLDAITAFVAIIFFAFQLYLDFSAYSDIAIGAARVLGFNLSLNFKRPYMAYSLSDFWKRWHISLSSWFKDYVYIPLGGRKNRVQYICNILIVFSVSGLWHGASWNFVVWGLLNGLFLLLFQGFFKSINRERLLNRILVSVSVFLLWALTLVFFRSQTFNSAFLMLSDLGVSTKDVLYSQGLNKAEFYFTVKVLFAYILFEIMQERYSDLYNWFVSRYFMFRWCVYIFIIAAILFLGSYGTGLDDRNFIYFQF